jgi:hypothetical protein
VEDQVQHLRALQDSEREREFYRAISLDISGTAYSLQYNLEHQ